MRAPRFAQADARDFYYETAYNRTIFENLLV